MIPKSLHTVRVLVVIAQTAMSVSSKTAAEAVDFAANRLGYADTADVYGLKAKAVAQIAKAVQS